MNFFYKNKKTALVAILVVYGLSFLIGYLSYQFWTSLLGTDNFTNVLIATFCIDILATLIVWLFSLIFKNASVYDPYWSVAPIAIVGFWLLKSQASGLHVHMMTFAIVLWGLRLTYNWFINFKGMQHEDWRYIHYRTKNPRLWLITNLFGIHIMPTIVVFLALIPISFVFFVETVIISWPIFIVGFILSVTAVITQYISDQQMRQFRQNKTNQGKHIDLGLWKYSRHPNYFGEVLMWWSVWVMQMAITSQWLTIIGPVIVTLLFVFISIPLMEKHIIEKIPTYAQYQNEVPALVFKFKRKSKMSSE